MDQQEMVTKLKKLNSAIEDFLDRWDMDEADEEKSDENKEEK